MSLTFHEIGRASAVGTEGDSVQPGTLVRLKGDPSTIGTVTEKPAVARANRKFVEIELASARRLMLPELELELVPTAPDALADLTSGRYSSPDDLRRALTHLRMTGKLADIIYSIGATNTEFHAYQFKPVLKLLNAPSRGVLTPWSFAMIL